MVIACIGTPSVSGDSVAPIVGDILISLGVDAYIYGTTNRPITAINYNDYANAIKVRHADELIIAVDSALGLKKDIGCIKIVRGGVNPGGALKKNLTKIGEIGILAQVGDSKGDALFELMNVPYSHVYSLAKKCVTIICKLLESVSHFN